MIDDIRPSRAEQRTGVAVQAPTPPTSRVSVPEPPSQPVTAISSRKKRRWPWIIGISILVVVLLAGISCFLWWRISLQPVNNRSDKTIRVVIETGKSPDQIANQLKQANVIRNPLVFSWYVKLHRVANDLQAGTYSISQKESLPQIVGQITEGKTDSLKVTFLPGATVSENEAVLGEMGFSKQSIEAAFAKKYDDPLFTSAPASADLEGYIYGETYEFNAGVTPEQILQKTFAEYDMVVKNDNLVAGFQAQGLTLYQGITLASIIQREVQTPSDMRQVAQVFLLRLKQGMPLGSDVTFEYAAKKLGVSASPTLDSPYNTRIHTGLPPGPISSPGQQALLAVANPASGDYLYFLSGDDGKTYFAHTIDQHEANVKNYCKVKCSDQ